MAASLQTLVPPAFFVFNPGDIGQIDILADEAVIVGFGSPTKVTLTVTDLIRANSAEGGTAHEA